MYCLSFLMANKLISISIFIRRRPIKIHIHSKGPASDDKNNTKITIHFFFSDVTTRSSRSTMPEDDGGGVALDDLGDIRRVCSPTAKAMGVFKFNTSILNKAIESNIIIAPSFSSPSRDVEPAAVTSDRVSAGMLTSATEKVAVRSQTCMLCGLQGSFDNNTLFCLVFSVTSPLKKDGGCKARCSACF